MKNIIVAYSAWEHGEYVITMRPAKEKAWRDMPVGNILSKTMAIEIEEWLQSAMPEIQKIVIQTEADKNV